MGKTACLAERYRAHAEAFRLAQELGVSPKAAAEELARRAARARWEQSSHDLAATIAQQISEAGLSCGQIAAAMNERGEPWMMRD